MSRSMLRRWALAGVVLLVGCGPGLTESPPQFLPITAQWCLEGPAPPRCIQLEVPRGERQYAMGLQLRPPLPQRRGMWFPYAPPEVARFWMHRTPEPLDMLFIRDGRVVALEKAVPPCMNLPCRSYGPDTAVDGVLELAAGQAAVLGISVGTQVRIKPLPGASPSAPARD
ncbi:DUF192 domain-containing protein [Cyanobium sp. Cruz CV13-4-11]|jgi:uncharacterized protein|uniref:DUF192 domain-containing protein n=1 Tax=unclassified Cyanobium TaxID=2627006 RepID=UPI0020CD3938|nr:MULTISPECIES: DUF192 domain-containing protein [unclassified Cyanobium]MCP9900205.1 DUF192 domain-containing protein [Cyanobium sp. Cruz CV11-17]MCP9918518.1 DUF192 domain-containing protein [Cyanobium sp. Cruz CV13-4-11]